MISLPTRQASSSPGLDRTHDQNLRSWVLGADGHLDFPIQNLPLAIFVPPDGIARGGIGIGDHILDLPALLATGLLAGDASLAAAAASGSELNAMLALGAGPRIALRDQVSTLLQAGCPDTAAIAPCLHAAADCRLLLPARIGDYTDFYVGIHHAESIGRLFRPDNPLLPNYKHVPIGYHGRASSIRPSGTAIRRPHGQSNPPGAESPLFAPTKRLDYELELGIWIGAGNALGAPIPVGEAHTHIAGFCLLNDWSARDVQAWEYQPLGPFLAKNFASTISPWIITPEALAPFRMAQPTRPDSDPRPLPYLYDDADQNAGAFDIALEVLLSTPGLRAVGMEPHRLASSNTRHMYWTAAQMVAHHASGGCNLQPGDLLGTGTISGPGPDACGSLVEATRGGTQPIRLSSGEERRFLEDGDEIILTARAERSGFATIGFGECWAIVLPAI